MKVPKYFNAHHSPIGSFASFTLGQKGPKGGLGLELAGPADEPVYVGVEEPGGDTFRALPFFGHAESAAADFDVEGRSEFEREPAMTPFDDDEIERTMGAGVDEWRAGDLTFRIISPPQSVPDPTKEDARDALTPAVVVELTVDNRNGQAPRKMFFGYGGSDRSVGMRLLDEPGLTGVGQGTSIAIASADPGLWAGVAWQPEAILSPRRQQNLGFMLGSLGLIVGTVEPGEVRTIRFAVGFFREGTATTGIRTRYLYRRWFERVEDVLHHALARFDFAKELALAFDARLSSHLAPERAWMAAHSIRSYFGATQLLEREDGRPLWVVHEGEYRMMNTLDLTVDQAYFELALNPWTVRNELDLFVEHYSYEDGVVFPNCDQLHPGGLAFTHDMGVSNAFAPKGNSGYEQAGLRGCFSFMSSEELMNWVLTAGLYFAETQDMDWIGSNAKTIRACLSSMENRDHPDPTRRNGVMGLDAARCEGGSEITTYDSLDESLGQARNNLYLAVKGWATYLVLESLLLKLGDSEAASRALVQARKAAATVVASRDADGLLPAVIGEGIEARIIPAIEALVYPHVIGISVKEFEDLVSAVHTHFRAVLRPGVCRFDDGGWRLSSTSANSWLSKIYLCQYVAEQILGHEPDRVADQAHQQWLLDEENAYFAWSDQMLAGKAVGSRYYPRGVTSLLWLGSKDRPISGIREKLLGV
jgi:hypothetical protein